MTIENMKLRERTFYNLVNTSEDLITAINHLYILKKMEFDHFYILARKYGFLDEKLCQLVP